MYYCWWSACVCGPGPRHRVGVGVRHPAKWGLVGRHNSHF